MQKKAKTLSIVIPAYNEERYLPACLDSIATQTVKPDEVIVVDNNSTDKTVAIAKRYSFVKLINESQQGLVFARTAGFNAARGDIFIRIDADIQLKDDWIDRLKMVVEEYPETAGFTGRGIFYDSPLPKISGWMQVLVYQGLQFLAMHGFTLWGSCMAIRREVWQEISDDCHLRNDIDEDIDIALQLRKRGYKIRFDSRMQFEVSLLRGKTSPWEVARYLSTWPRDYWINRYYISALYVAILTIGVVVFGSWAWALSLPFRHKTV